MGEDLIRFFIEGFGKLLLRIVKVIIWTGAIVFSAFSMFKTPPIENYNTDDLEKKIGIIFTGIITIVFLIWGLTKLKALI